MKILTVPNPILRTVAQPVSIVDKKVWQFIKDMDTTLRKQESPRGVGLAAPQVGKGWRIFLAVLGEKNQNSDHPRVEVFINPRIVKHSKERILGLENGEDRFEGCLSIPKLYGPVPRYEFVEVAYQTITPKQLKGSIPTQLTTTTKRFTDFDARIIQHEYDHLDGILFTDYSLKENLPVYVEQAGEWREVSNKAELLATI